MDSLAIAGLLGGLSIAHAAVGLCCVTIHARRRSDVDLLLFGLLNLGLVLFDAALTHEYALAGDLRREIELADAGRAISTALLVHFVLRYAVLPRPRWALLALHGAAGFFVLAGALGLLADHAHASRAPVWIFGLHVHSASAPPTALGVIFAIGCLAGPVFALFALGRAFAGGRREGVALGGAVLLAATAGYDAARALGLAAGPPLAPHGFAAFVLGLMMTLISRFVSLRLKLDHQTSELHERSRALARSYDDLRAAQDELVRKEQLAAVGELSAVIAHEVRNPLAIMSNAVATLRRKEVSAEDRDTLLGILDEEASRLNRLVGDLLRYARPVNIERQLISLRDIAERALTLAEGHPDVIAELSEPVTVEKIWGDPNLLRQVVENLITNAMQAMADVGTLTVSLAPMDLEGARGVELSIQDTGEGMDTLVRSRALDPFFTTRPSGTGLGLAIVARIIDAHGGRLRIKSAAGAGTVMHVFLPISGEPLTKKSDPPDRGPSSLPPMPIEIRKAIGARPRRT